MVESKRLSVPSLTVKQVTVTKYQHNIWYILLTNGGAFIVVNIAILARAMF